MQDPALRPMLASNRILRNVTAAVAALGFDAELVLRRASLSWQDLEKVDGEDQRMPVEALNRFWTAVVAVTGDPGIGVRIGALARLDNLGVLGSVARASATLGDALLKAGRYWRLWIETTRLSLLVEGEQGEVVYRSLGPANPTAADAVLAQLIVLSRELTGRKLVPSQVRFAHPRPPDDSVYREVFGVTPTFDEFEHALVFPADVLMLPIATHDFRQAELLSAQASQLVDGLSPEASFSRRVRELLATELRGGNPMIENVAPSSACTRRRSLGASSRRGPATVTSWIPSVASSQSVTSRRRTSTSPKRRSCSASRTRAHSTKPFEDGSASRRWRSAVAW